MLLAGRPRVAGSARSDRSESMARVTYRGLPRQDRWSERMPRSNPVAFLIIIILVLGSPFVFDLLAR